MVCLRHVRLLGVARAANGYVNFEPTQQPPASASVPAPAKHRAPARAEPDASACRLAVERAAEVRSFEDPVFAEPGQVRSMRESAWRQRAYRECMAGS